MQFRNSRFTILFGKGVGGQAQRCRKRRDIRDVRNLEHMRRELLIHVGRVGRGAFLADDHLVKAMVACSRKRLASSGVTGARTTWIGSVEGLEVAGPLGAGVGVGVWLGVGVGVGTGAGVGTGVGAGTTMIDPAPAAAPLPLPPPRPHAGRSSPAAGASSFTPTASEAASVIPSSTVKSANRSFSTQQSPAVATEMLTAPCSPHLPGGSQQRVRQSPVPIILQYMPGFAWSRCS